MQLLRSFAMGSYAVGEDDARIHQTEANYDDGLLRAYRTEMYGRRFKRSMLSRRNSLVVQLIPVELRGLAYNHKELVSEDHILTLNVTANLNELGVGSLVFWINLTDSVPFSVPSLLPLRDP